MSRNKICMVIIGICLLVSCLSGCGKNESAELADGVFLRLSSTTKGEGVETAEMYTLHVEISQNGQVRIYADNFNRWISTDPCPEETMQLSADVIQEIKARIKESDLYHMRKNIGNRDLKDGEYKELTVYTTDGEHASGGLNPSNREFLNVFDYVEDQIRETEYMLRAKITQMQKQGLEAEKNKNVTITDAQDQMLVPKDAINDVYVTCGENREKVDMTATPEAKPETNYYVTLLLADAGAETMRMDTEECTTEDVTYYKIYKDNAYAFTFCVQEPITGDEICVYETMDAEEAVKLAQELRDSLY